jgi:hypothetical protein
VDEQPSYRHIWHRLQIIESLEGHLGGKHWDLAAPGSDLAGDDELTSPYQTSHVAGHALSFGLDMLRTARIVLVNPEKQNGLRMPLFGVFPVLRSAMEAGAEAVWLLADDDRHERVGRTLRARWEDIIRDDQAVLASTDEDDNDGPAERSGKSKMRRENSKAVRAKKGRLRAVAKKVGVTEEVLTLGLPGFGPMLKETARYTGIQSNYQRGVWHWVSGLTHPSMSRAISMSVVEDKGPASAEVVSAELTADPTTIGLALDSALLLHWRALELAALRGGRPEVSWQPPADFPMPPGFKDPRPKS